jgi:hypothetical protein
MEAGIFSLARVANEGSCAVVIQTKYRGKLEHRNIVKAAIKVQAAGRGSKVRRDLGAAKEKLRAEQEELQKAEGSAPKRTKSQERRQSEDRADGGGEAIALRHQRPDPDVEPAELQRQLKLYVNQLEKQERTLKQQIEKIKRERPYLNAADQRGNTEKRRAAQRKLEENAVELRAQRELQHDIRATEKVQGHLIGKGPVKSTRATALESFETRLGAMQRRWRRRQARLLLAPKLTKVCLRLRAERAPPVSLTLRATGDEQPCAVRMWATFAAPPPKRKGDAASAHVVVAAALRVRREAVEEEEEGGGRPSRVFAALSGEASKAAAQAGRQRLLEVMLGRDGQLPGFLLAPPRTAARLRLELIELAMTRRLSDAMLRQLQQQIAVVAEAASTQKAGAQAKTAAVKRAEEKLEKQARCLVITPAIVSMTRRGEA